MRKMGIVPIFEKEHEIIARVLAGEQDAYAALVDAYKGTIFNLAFRMTGSYEDADDLAQETFIRAYEKLRRFDAEKRFFTWLYTISLNLIRNHLKKRGHDLSREATGQNILEGGSRGGASMEQNMIQAQETLHLERCLLMLPADLREAVVLRFYQDLSFEEIAIISDASISAVKMRVYRGLERLQQLMGNG
jgi:RNA polymerase sigma-70 factor (ECF subfamily)